MTFLIIASIAGLFLGFCAIGYGIVQKVKGLNGWLYRGIAIVGIAAAVLIVSVQLGQKSPTVQNFEEHAAQESHSKAEGLYCWFLGMFFGDPAAPAAPTPPTYSYSPPPPPPPAPTAIPAPPSASAPSAPPAGSGSGTRTAPPPITGGHPGAAAAPAPGSASGVSYYGVPLHPHRNGRRSPRSE